jgi:hypothetical protein
VTSSIALGARHSFLFPWAEATLTLEDTLLLGGYSALGLSVSSPMESEELNMLENDMNNVRLELMRTKDRKATIFAWFTRFNNSGTDFEHEVFLTYWLTRFVFPNKSDAIRRCINSVVKGY